MGRFTSVQGFADNNSNNRTITLDQAKGNSNNGTSGDNKKLITEKVVNPYGSVSGAGSGEFHVYRHARARELARWNALDLEAKEKQEELEFRASLETDEKQQETKASKNRRKRQREKEAKRRKKFMKAAGIDLHEAVKNNTNDSEEEFTYIPVAKRQQQEKVREDENESSSKAKETSTAGLSSGSGTIIPNDGSFLEMMKRKLQEEREGNHQQNAISKEKESDKTNEKGNLLGDENATKANAINTGGSDEESDEEGPALPPGK